MTHQDTDYSQSGEQAAIFGAIAQVDPKISRFLDIGAGDGETFSNTRALALAGWGGVCVEPAAWAFDKLTTLYGDSLVQPCCAVVTPDHCGLEMWLYSKDDHLSTIEPEHAEAWAQVPFKTVTIAAVSLSQLLDWFEGRFSVVSIDAEGVTSQLVRAYIRHPAWEAVQVICYEREWHSPLTLRGAFDLVVETPNNYIYRRVA